MLETVGKALVSALPTAIGSGIGAWSQQRANEANIASQEKINKANLDHANYWNEKNYALASEAQQAQLAQQTFANEQYIENRDYERQLQQEIFHREDTALQRSLQQATDAGFSPLTALGINTGAGSVISSSSAPSSMVSNNQASVQGAGQIAPHVQALTSGDGFAQIGAMFATMAEGQSMRDHQDDMQTAEFAQKLLELDKGHFAQMIIKQMEYDFIKDRDNQLHLYAMAEKLQDEAIQRRILSVVHGHEASMQEDDQAHQLYMQGRQHAFSSSNANDSGSGRGLHDVTRDLIDILGQGDSSLARWLKQNQQIITLMIEGLEIAAKSFTGNGSTQNQVVR